MTISLLFLFKKIKIKLFFFLILYKRLNQYVIYSITDYILLLLTATRKRIIKTLLKSFLFIPFILSMVAGVLNNIDTLLFWIFSLSLLYIFYIIESV